MLLNPWESSLSQPHSKTEEPWHKKKTIQVKLLVVLCTSTYICILGIPTLASLGGVPSTLHLKMKYHSRDNQAVVTINTNRKGTQRYIRTFEETLSTTLLQHLQFWLERLSQSQMGKSRCYTKFSKINPYEFKFILKL
jgi:hypothetical protein